MLIIGADNPFFELYSYSQGKASVVLLVEDGMGRFQGFQKWMEEHWLLFMVEVIPNGSERERQDARGLYHKEFEKWLEHRVMCPTIRYIKK